MEALCEYELCFVFICTMHHIWCRLVYYY
uniref:Uncharacterized protein n=1 Tax=Anguilla anguilla TaxID=7936 RepID=A0A0E9UH68_ANGAN